MRGTTLAARGWTQEGGELYEVLARLDRDGCARYVVTDVGRDGTLTGPEPRPAARRLRRDRPAGGRQRRRVGAGRPRGPSRRWSPLGVEGAIVGKALYAGAFTLPRHALAEVAA